jgi:general secretion pathway protein I
MRPDRYNAGYTLIEVLVAFMILALALTVLLRIFAAGVRNVSVSSDYARAVLIAESRLAATGIDGVLAPGETSGIEEDRFEWIQTVEEYTPSPDYQISVQNVPAFYVTVSVAWPHGDGSRSVGLSTVRLLLKEGRGS